MHAEGVDQAGTGKFQCKGACCCGVCNDSARFRTWNECSVCTPRTVSEILAGKCNVRAVRSCLECAARGTDQADVATERIDGTGDNSQGRASVCISVMVKRTMRFHIFQLEILPKRMIGQASALFGYRGSELFRRYILTAAAEILPVRIRRVRPRMSAVAFALHERMRHGSIIAGMSAAGDIGDVSKLIELVTFADQFAEIDIEKTPGHWLVHGSKCSVRHAH